MAQSHVLKVHDVTVTYADGEGTIVALHRANFALAPGQMGAIVGESGSGKSTLLAVAGGLIVPDSGMVEVAGNRVESLDDQGRTAIRRDHIGLVFQTPGLLGSLIVRDQLLMTDHLRGVRGSSLRQRRSRADELLERVGLPGMGDRKITQLSGGQRQRVAVARALMGAPELLLADEPTSALDAANSRSVMGLLRELVDDTGIACAVVTHDRSLLSFFDVVAEVADGEVSGGSLAIAS